MEQTKEFGKTLEDFGKALSEIQDSIYEAQNKIEDADLGEFLSTAEKQLLTDEKLPKKERKKKVIEMFRQKYPKQMKTLDEFDDLIEGFNFVLHEKLERLDELSNDIEEAKDTIERARDELDGL